MPEEEKAQEIVRPAFVIKITRKDGTELTMTPAGVVEAVGQKEREEEKSCKERNLKNNKQTNEVTFPVSLIKFTVF